MESNGKRNACTYLSIMMLKHVRMDHQDALVRLRDQVVEEVWYKGIPRGRPQERWDKSSLCSPAAAAEPVGKSTVQCFTCGRMGQYASE